MSEKITFYHNPMSRGRVAHWMLEETGMPYEVRLVALNKGEQKQAEYLKVNPMGKVPAIVHRGTVVTETPAICAYLADAFPEKQLAPATTDPARGAYLRWLFFGASCVEQALADRAFPRVQPANAGQIGYGTYEDTLRALESALRPGPWILGDRFSAADVYLGSQIGWGLFIKTLEPKPVFQEYVARCNERPAAQRARAMNDRYVEEMQKG